MIYRIDVNERFLTKFMSFSKIWDTNNDIKSKLSNDQITLPKKSYFGWFLELKQIKWGAKIVHQLR